MRATRLRPPYLLQKELTVLARSRNPNFPGSRALDVITPSGCRHSLACGPIKGLVCNISVSRVPLDRKTYYIYCVITLPTPIGIPNRKG